MPTGPFFTRREGAAKRLTQGEADFPFRTLVMVGYSGFEPLTSSMSRKRSNQLS